MTTDFHEKCKACGAAIGAEEQWSCEMCDQPGCPVCMEGYGGLITAHPECMKPVPGDHNNLAIETLRDYLSWLSEEIWCAGWLCDWENIVWHEITGDEAYARLTADERDRVIDLAEQAGGWVRWNKEPGVDLVFVPMAEWLADPTHKPLPPRSLDWFKTKVVDALGLVPAAKRVEALAVLDEILVHERGLDLKDLPSWDGIGRWNKEDEV